MKTRIALILLAAAMLVPTARAATVNWSGTLVTDPQINIDSNGATLADTYTFAIGIFDDGFTPTENNLHDWVGNFTVFDVAKYNNDNGYFGSSAVLEPDGSRLDVPPGTPPESGTAGGSLVDYTTAFAGKNAFLWVYNTTATGSASWEWALVRSTSWVFPTFVSGVCCDTEEVTWSVADVDVLVYGGANDDRGPGTYGSTPPTFQIQTAVPEPSGTVIFAISALGLLLRRKRNADA